MNRQRARGILLIFEQGTYDNESPTTTRYRPTRHHRRQLFPQIPLLLCTCPLTRSLTSFGSAAATVDQKNTLRLILPFQAWKRRIHSALFWLISKKMSAILFRLFVCSFFYLPYCSYKTYRWVDECIVLLLLTCLRLYGFAVSVFGG